MPNLVANTSVKDIRRQTGVLHTDPNGNFADKQSLTLIGQDSTLGWRNTTWKDDLERGADASTSYDRKSIDFPGLILNTVYYPKTGPKKAGIITSNYRGTINPFTSIPSVQQVFDADDRALKVIKGKLMQSSEEFRALLPLVEIRQTQSLIQDTAESTINLLTELYKISTGKGKFRELRRRASAAWLNFSFGIAPTLSDIHALTQSVASYYNGVEGFRQRFTGQAAVSWMDEQKIQTTYIENPVFYSYGRVFREMDYSVRYIAGVKYNINSSWNGTVHNLDQHFGLRFEQLLPAFWELVPCSWVVDYFTTVGDYLNDIVETPSGMTSYIVKCQRFRCKAWQNVSTQNNAPLSYTVQNTGYRGRHEANSFHFKRTPLESLPHRSLRIKTANEIAGRAVNKALNLASVVLSSGEKRIRNRRPIV